MSRIYSVQEWESTFLIPISASQSLSLSKTLLIPLFSHGAHCFCRLIACYKQTVCCSLQIIEYLRTCSSAAKPRLPGTKWKTPFLSLCVKICFNLKDTRLYRLFSRYPSRYAKYSKGLRSLMIYCVIKLSFQKIFFGNIYRNIERSSL